MPVIKRRSINPIGSQHDGCKIKRHRAGFTLIEAFAATMILSILVLGVCSTLGTSYQQSETVRSNANAIALARQLADEITARPLADPSDGTTTLGPGSFTARAQFTHVTNYDGYTDTSTAAPTLAGGSLDVTGGDVYRRAVSVTLGAKPSIDTVSPATDFAIVTVTVTSPLGQSVAITKVVPKYSIQR